MADTDCVALSSTTRLADAHPLSGRQQGWLLLLTVGQYFQSSSGQVQLVINADDQLIFSVSFYFTKTCQQVFDKSQYRIPRKLVNYSMQPINFCLSTFTNKNWSWATELRHQNLIIIMTTIVIEISRNVDLRLDGSEEWVWCCRLVHLLRYLLTGDADQITDRLCSIRVCLRNQIQSQCSDDECT